GKRQARAAEAGSRCRSVSGGDPDPNSRVFACEIGASGFDSLGALMDTEVPDAAIVATPTLTHFDVTRRLVEAGVVVLLEKPIAGDLEQARKIVDLSQQSGVRICIGHHRRHNPLTDRARTIVQNGDLGKLVGVNALWALTKHHGYFELDWHVQPGAGPILSNLIHDLDVLRYVCGEIDSIFARTSSEHQGYAVEDTFALVIGFSSGAMGTMIGSDSVASPWAWDTTTGEYPMFPAHDEACYHFLGTDESLAFPQMEVWKYGSPGDPNWFTKLRAERRAGDSGTPLERQLQHLCDLTLGRAEPVVSAKDAARSRQSTPCNRVLL
ncbi:MAG: Gfo/Idh/MocA family oxidoreductase, partial [Geminicoccaceae bacterium]